MINSSLYRFGIITFSVIGIISCNLSADVPSASIKNQPQPVQQIQKWLALPPESRGTLPDQDFATEALTKAQAKEIEKLLWDAHIKRIIATRRDEWTAKKMELDNLTMKYEAIIYGEAPEDGHSLYISMHGGGNAPAQVNDQQWRNQIRLYEPKEGIYVAPRAPTNDWNLWHKDHIDDFFDRLIENAIVLGNVNPNRVYIMGYSAGGDGVYQLAGRMADRWAAASMMAGHPNDSSPLGVRNIGFSLWVGENDSAYKRNEVVKEWGEKLTALHQNDPDGYRFEVHIQPGMSHWMNRTDAAAVPWMATFTRNPFPTKVVWKQDDVTHDRFYWLAVPAGKAQKGAEAVVFYQDQTITIEKADLVEILKIRLNDTMMDLDQPVKVIWNNKTVVDEKVNRTPAVIDQTLSERGDPTAIYSAELSITLAE